MWHDAPSRGYAWPRLHANSQPPAHDAERRATLRIFRDGRIRPLIHGPFLPFHRRSAARTFVPQTEALIIAHTVESVAAHVALLVDGVGANGIDDDSVRGCLHPQGGAVGGVQHQRG